MQKYLLFGFYVKPWSLRSDLKIYQQQTILVTEIESLLVDLSSKIASKIII